MQALLLFFIRLYQRLLSPLLHSLCGGTCGCRFYPTCSAYMHTALCQHGTTKGLFLGLKRILRCHPWHPGGYDPVPSIHSKKQKPLSKSTLKAS